MVAKNFEDHLERIKEEFAKGLVFLKHGYDLAAKNQVQAGGPPRRAYYSPMPQVNDP